MEYMVTVGVGLFITWIAIAIVISLVEYPEIWQMLLIVALSPLWLVYKLLWLFYKLFKYPIQEKNKLIYLKKSSVIKSWKGSPNMRTLFIGYANRYFPTISFVISTLSNTLLRNIISSSTTTTKWVKFW